MVQNIRSTAVMGSVFEIHSNQNTSDPSIEQAFLLADEIDQALSTYKEQSQISQFNKLSAKTPMQLSNHMKQMLEQSHLYFNQSNQLFNPLIYPLVQLWGFDQKYRNDEQIPQDFEIKAKQVLLDWNLIQRTENEVRKENSLVQLDFGGIAKGYALDLVADILSQPKAHCGVANLGKQVMLFGDCFEKKGMAFELQDPVDPKKSVGTILLTKGSIATSGNYERFFIYEGKTYSHILDPRTGYPSQGVASATVWAEKAMDADAWSTVMFVLGPQKGRQMIDDQKLKIGVVWVLENGTMETTMYPIGIFMKNPT